jgi:hypothetical protein
MTIFERDPVANWRRIASHVQEPQAAMSNRTRANLANRLWNIAVLALLLGSPAAFGQPADAFRQAAYTVFSGELNGDSQTDFLVVAKRKIVMIPLDDLVIPIPLPPVVPSFVVWSGSTIGLDPSASLIADPRWTANTHGLIYGDTNGDGTEELLIRALGANGTSMIVALSSSSTPLLHQVLNVATLGVDLGTGGSTVQLRDTNRDGRMDLVVSSSAGLVTNVLLADADGRFAAPVGSGGSAYAAWAAFCASLDLGNLNSALTFLTPAAQATYTDSLIALGPNLTALTSTWSNIQILRENDNLVEFLVTDTIVSVPRIHVVIVERDPFNKWLVAQF